MKDGKFEVGDRVKYVGKATPEWRGECGTVRGEECGLTEVAYDNFCGCVYADPTNIELLPPENVLPEQPKTSESGELKDSGARRQFSTGAVRDMACKGRCDLIPWSGVAFLYGDSLEKQFCLAMAKATHKVDQLESIQNAFAFFTALAFGGSRETALLEVAFQYEAGCKKYGDRNFEKGIPVDSLLDSGGRHFLKFVRGDTDERHDRACAWNLLTALWMIENRPEMVEEKL